MSNGYINFRPAGMSDDEESDSDKEFEFDPQFNQINGNYDDEFTPTDRWTKFVNSEENCTSSAYSKHLGPGTPYFQSQIEEFQAAIINGDMKNFERLLNEGLSCDQVFPASFDSFGKNPLFLACENGQHEILAYLLKANVSLNPLADRFTPLMAVCCSSNDNCDNLETNLVRCAQLLLNNGQSTNPNDHQSQQMTALMFACKYGKIKLVEELLKNKSIDLDAQDSQKWTSLLYAVDECHGDIARLLLEAGANPDIPSRDGILPADLAATKNITTLQNIVHNFSKFKGIKVADVIEKNYECIKYSEVDNVLLGLDAKDFIPAFKSKSTFY